MNKMMKNMMMFLLLALAIYTTSAQAQWKEAGAWQKVEIDLAKDGNDKIYLSLWDIEAPEKLPGSNEDFKGDDLKGNLKGLNVNYSQFQACQALATIATVCISMACIFTLAEGHLPMNTEMWSITGLLGLGCLCMALSVGLFAGLNLKSKVKDMTLVLDIANNVTITDVKASFGPAWYTGIATAVIAGGFATAAYMNKDATLAETVNPLARSSMRMY